MRTGNRGGELCDSSDGGVWRGFLGVFNWKEFECLRQDESMLFDFRKGLSHPMHLRCD